MSERLWALAAVALVALAVQGCNLRLEGGGDGGGVGGSGGIAGTGFGGAGFGGSFSGTGGFFGMDAGSAGGGGVGPSVSCAFQACPPPADLGPAMGLLVPCCTADQRCGLFGLFVDQCLPIDAIGRDDLTCPTATLVGMPVAGCCTPQGACGFNLDQVSLGCVERRNVSNNGFVDFGGHPVDIACFSGLVDAGADDAGADDAGDPICDWARGGLCDPIALCHAEDGNPVCSCPDGYADLSTQGEQGRICRDVNECLLGPSVCDGGTCVNTVGGFVCNN